MNLSGCWFSFCYGYDKYFWFGDFWEYVWYFGCLWFFFWQIQGEGEENQDQGVYYGSEDEGGVIIYFLIDCFCYKINRDYLIL